MTGKVEMTFTPMINYPFRYIELESKSTIGYLFNFVYISKETVGKQLGPSTQW